MGDLSFRWQLTGAGLLFLLLLLLVPYGGHTDDLAYWVRWASYSLEHGLGNIYEEPTNNYPPLYHYVLWAFGQLMGSPEKIFQYRHSLKIFTLLFDFAGAFWAVSLVEDHRFRRLLLLLLNIGYLYNSLIWIQVDAIYTFFAFGAVVLAMQGSPVRSGLCFALALLAKTQAVIFLPPLLLLWLPLWWQRPKALGQTIVAVVLLVTLVLAPFIWGGEQNSLPQIIAVVLGAAETYPQLAMGADNIWRVLFDSSTPDMLPFAGLTYRYWGLLFFFSFSAFTLLPLLLLTVRRIRRAGKFLSLPAKDTPLLPKTCQALVLLSCGLIPILFCFFNTQMHERYWHAAILFLAAYGFVQRDYWLYVLVSVAYFLNLEQVLDYLRESFGLMDHRFFFLKSWFPAVLFALSIGIGLVKLYRLAQLRPHATPVPDNAGAVCSPL